MNHRSDCVLIMKKWGQIFCETASFNCGGVMTLTPCREIVFACSYGT